MQQLDPKAIWIFFVRFLIIIIVFGFIFGIYGVAFLVTYGLIAVESLPSLLIAFVIAVALFAYVWARLSVYYYRYELTEAVFKKEYGVIYKRYVSIPYERVQNVDIGRGLVARILGLSTLVIQTAGMSGTARSEGVLPGLLKEIAEELREEIINKVGKSKNQGL